MAEHDGSFPSREMESTGFAVGPGAILGDYRLEKLLGRGGMGEVWKAYDEVGDRHVVLKFLPAELQHNTEEMRRVKQTFQHVHALHHQHICPVHALGRHPEIGYFLVMKFIDGMTLADSWRSHRPADQRVVLKAVVDLLRPVADALDYAHARKVIHRDVKPQNIMVRRDGCDVQLVDFGLADEVRSSMAQISNVRIDVSGTRPYMAPEQWRGQFQNGATDQYALAIVAYELLSGHPPFVGKDDSVLLHCVLNESPEPIAGLPDSANRALRRALGKSRDERFESCLQFVEAMTGDGPSDPAQAVQANNNDAGHLAPTVIASSLRGDDVSVTMQDKQPGISGPVGRERGDLADGVRETVARSHEQLRRKRLVASLIALQKAQRIVFGSAGKYQVIVALLMLAFCSIWLPIAIYHSYSRRLSTPYFELARNRVERMYPHARYNGSGNTYETKVNGKYVTDEVATREYLSLEKQFSQQDKAVKDYNMRLFWGMMALGLAMPIAGSVIIVFRRRRSIKRAKRHCETIPGDLAREFPEESAAWGGAEALIQPPIVQELIKSLKRKAYGSSH